MDLADRVPKKDKRVVARLITLIESKSPEATEALKQLYKYTGNSFVIGITGPPGAGKSSLVNELAKKIWAKGKMDYIIIETVGVGQSEIDIVKLADTVVLVLVPRLGDDVEVIKAGIMEIADIFAVNKSDREGADRLVTEIEMMLNISQKQFDFRSPVVKTVAVTGEGIDTLKRRIREHLGYISKNGF